VPEIRGVVVAHFGCDGEVGAEEGGSEFGNQFFEGVGVVAETLSETSGLAS
jgi:hypothetical protein